MNSRIVLIPMVVLSLAMLAGCGDDEPAPAKAPADTQAAQPSATPDRAAPAPRQVPRPKPKSIKEQLDETVEMPDFYPSDGPVYPNGNLNTAIRMPGNRISAVFSTEDSQEEVTSFLDAELAKQGWENVETQEMPNGMVSQGFKGRRNISVLISRLEAENKTLIAVSVSPSS